MKLQKMGIDACVEKLGRDFIKMHKDTSWAGYGDAEDYAFCYVGVDDRPEPNWNNSEIVLDDGRIEFQNCVLPKVPSI